MQTTIHTLRDERGRPLAYTVACECGYRSDVSDRVVAEQKALRHQQRDHATGTKVTWSIPMEVLVTVEVTDSEVEPHVSEVVVVPRESDAGYFGPPSFVYESNFEGDGYDGPGPDLDLWPAVQRYLAATGGTLVADWQE